jgi:hypothetical protein
VRSGGRRRRGRGQFAGRVGDIGRREIGFRFRFHFCFHFCFRCQQRGQRSRD